MRVRSRRQETGDRRQERVRGEAKNREAKGSRVRGFKDSSGKPNKPEKQTLLFSIL